MQAWGLHGSFFIHKYSHYFPFRKPTPHIKHAIHPYHRSSSPYCELWSVLCIKPSVIRSLCCYWYSVLFRTWIYRLPTLTSTDHIVTTRSYRRSASVSITDHTWRSQFFFHFSPAAVGQYTVVLGVDWRIVVLQSPYIPTHDTIQENNDENFVMNAFVSKWDTQKLKWGNISLAQTFLNQTLLSQQHDTMCQSAQSE